MKNLPAEAGDTGDASLIPGLGRSPEEENGSLGQYSCLENSRKRGALWAIDSLPAELSGSTVDTAERLNDNSVVRGGEKTGVCSRPKAVLGHRP